MQLVITIDIGSFCMYVADHLNPSYKIYYLDTIPYAVASAWTDWRHYKGLKVIISVGPWVTWNLTFYSRLYAVIHIAVLCGCANAPLHLLVAT